MMISKTKARILITCIGGKLKSYEALFLKKKSKYFNYVVGVDTDDNAIGKKYVDKFYCVPDGDDLAYTDKLLEIVRKETIDLIIPCSDEEARTLSKNKHLFNELKCYIASVDFDTIKIHSNKISTYEKLKLHNIDVPLHYQIQNKTELTNRANYFISLRKSFVIKPSLSRGGRNVIIVYPNNLIRKSKNLARQKEVDIDDFFKSYIEEFDNLYPLIIMEKLNGSVFDLDMLCWKGSLKRHILRKRINDTDPNAGHEIIFDKRIEQVANSLSKIFNLSWLYDCDLMLDKDNNYQILEINPRPSGSAVVSMIAGNNFYDDIYDLLSGTDLDKQPKVNNLVIDPGVIKEILEK